MPKLKPETEQARREHILDTAEKCFARSGFHGTTMQMLCKEAGISPGALYVYFNSKEALIEGICERDRTDFSMRFSGIADAPDLLEALNGLAAHYFVDEPQHKLAMTVEIGAESTRNDTVRQHFQACDETVAQNLLELQQRLANEDRIKPMMPIADVAKTMQVIGDGLLWRRAIDPSFDGNIMLPAILQMVSMLIGPVEHPKAATSSSQTEAVSR